MKKILFLAVFAAISLSVSAQREYDAQKSFTHEVGLYFQDGWGFGYQLRKEFNPYFGWNIIGVSYMSCLNGSPADYGQVNIKLLGARAYTPSYRWIRGYADLNVGYTIKYGWNTKEPSHYLGLDFGVGLQVHKRFAVGYNLNYLGPEKIKEHWAKFSFLF
ncbi:MAG: hypothetical protein IK144_01260 [Bacteroidaceae bacterium]|nr:hypothetical protein [Bacteroidaceae bacterium]